MQRLLIAFAVAGLAMANAKTYSIDLFEPAMFGNTELRAGHYDVDVENNKAVVKSGKTHGECTVQMETADMKYNRTSVVLANEGGQKHIQEIHVGGSKTKLVFKE